MKDFDLIVTLKEIKEIIVEIQSLNPLKYQKINYKLNKAIMSLERQEKKNMRFLHELIQDGTKSDGRKRK